MTEPEPEPDPRKVRIGLVMVSIVVVVAIALVFVIDDGFGRALMVGVAALGLSRAYLLARSLRRS
jgi:hypothetical protein